MIGFRRYSKGVRVPLDQRGDAGASPARLDQFGFEGDALPVRLLGLEPAAPGHHLVGSLSSTVSSERSAVPSGRISTSPAAT